MVSRESSGNSTRLSMDVANLPLTPFGMKYQGSPRKLTSLSTNRFNKLSRRRGRDIQEDKRTAEYQYGKKENIDGLNSSQRRKQWPVGKPRVVGLHTVPEDKASPESSYTPEVKIRMHHHSKDSQILLNLRPTVDSPTANKAQSTKDAPTDSSGRRDSVYTDIDDGSFIEFCHGKEKEHHASCSIDDPSRKVALYYTCETDNDTQYSTSTKTNNAFVGFRKYLDKLKKQTNLRNVREETELEEVSVQDKVNMYNLHDETVITCSADVRKLLREGPPPAAINSTVMNKLPQDERVLLPCVFSEISTLTIQSEMALTPDSQYQSKQPRGQRAEHQIVVLSESSDEEESLPVGGGDGGLANLHGNARSVPRSDNVRVPPISGDVGDVKNMPLFCTNADQPKATHRPPSPELVASLAGKCPSMISEDISIISSTQESYVNTRHKNIRQVAPKTTDIDILSKKEGKVPVIYENRKKEESNNAGIGQVTPAKSLPSVKPSADKQIPENQANPVHKWVMTSPFKESSFDCSFLQRNEDSFISESPSQPKRADHKNESFESCAIELNYKHSTNPGKCKQGMNLQSLSKKHDSPIAEKSINLDSEESDCDFAVKPTKMKQRVIVSTSEESEDDKRNGRYVTHRRKKINTKIITESFEEDYIGASDSEEEESLCLRLSKSKNETNKNSEKTTQTIGKIALSPEPTVKNFNKADQQVSHKFKKSNHSCHLGVKCLENDAPCSMHQSASKEPLTTQLPKTGNSKYIGDSDGPLDLSLIRKELDDLYTTEWRKNEDVIFKTIPKEKKQENRSKKSFKLNRRRSKSCPTLKLESEEESSFLYNVNETSGDGEDDTNSSEEEKQESSDNNKSDPSKGGEEKNTKMTPRVPDSPEEDSFEEYLKKAKALTQQKKKLQEVKSNYEDEDRYESSFINDDSSDDESYSLPQVIWKPQNSPPVYHRTHKHKRSVSRTRDRDNKEEIHESNKNNGLNPSNKGDEKTAKTPPSPSEEDSFEEYLKKARVLTQQKKRHQKDQYFKENESSFITDDNSDDESYSLPPVTQKPLKTPSDPKHKITVLKKQGRGTIKINTSPRSNTTWRDSPTITLTSGSDSDEFYSLTETNKKLVQPLPSYTTPRTKARGKVLPKTEGHCRQFTKKCETGQLSPRLPFLASLSSNVNIIQCHPEALPYIKNFKKKKEEFVEKLYKYYNTHVFDGKLPSYMNIKWNVRLTKTAGYCYYQINKSTECRRGSRIELSTKVIDCAERLRDTLIHELCHAAAWIISGYKDGHGPLWKAWASKARAVFPELPAINRCHSYQIQCKYTYRCTGCSYSIGRHSKSLDTNKKVCGLCFGKFELLVNSKTQRGQDKATTGKPTIDPLRTPKTPGPFALFVKDNYGSVKKSTPNVKHGDVMRILSAKFEKMKTGGNQVLPS